MGNAACQSADGLKLLGLKPFLLQKVLFGDVVESLDYGDDGS
jgi:hypothetical protein